MIRVLLLLLSAHGSLLLAQESEIDLIHRRDEARGAFLATPQGVFRHYCAHCHGDDGRGSGRLWATDLSPKPADLVASRLDEAALVKFLSEGSAASGRSNLCPPWGRTIAAPDVKRLSRHLVSLRGAPANSQAAPALAPPVGERFPWTLAVFVAAELALLMWMLLRQKEASHVVPQDLAVRG